MGDKSLIEWTDATWNPVVGCTKVSPGCDHCYAVRATARTRPGIPFEQVTTYPDRLDQPLRWKRPRRVFVNSLSDLFHDDVPDEFIAQVFGVMARASWHTFQVLTKRPGRMASLVPKLHEFDPLLEDALNGGYWTPLNVWLGVSVEDQKWADVRIPKLLETPAAVRFLSCEPLLGPVDLANTLEGLDAYSEALIDWVIVGGESGPGARPMHPGWARLLRDQCASWSVPFFFKQWGEWAPSRGRCLDQALMWPDGSSRPDNGPPYTPAGWVNVERIGKKRAGRELDGRTWDEMPL